MMCGIHKQTINIHTVLLQYQTRHLLARLKVLTKLIYNSIGTAMKNCSPSFIHCRSLCIHSSHVRITGNIVGNFQHSHTIGMYIFSDSSLGKIITEQNIIYAISSRLSVKFYFLLLILFHIRLIKLHNGGKNITEYNITIKHFTVKLHLYSGVDGMRFIQSNERGHIQLNGIYLCRTTYVTSTCTSNEIL